MRPVQLLARLNDADLAVEATRALMADLALRLKEPPVLTGARAALAKAESELAACREVQRAGELASEESNARLQTVRERLYSGKVTNPRELADLERDAEMLQRLASEVEDGLLEAMLCQESAVAAQESAQETLRQETQRWNEQRATLLAERERLHSRLPAESRRQAAARAAVPPDLLAVYDGLRPRRAGRAVAELDDDTCSGCRVAVPPQLLAAARDSDELVYCGNCGRLIWAE
jgi:predicted  nucleic acid-binding Zn-ribbon protein